MLAIPVSPVTSLTTGWRVLCIWGRAFGLCWMGWLA
jgi:hypothetical protein